MNITITEMKKTLEGINNRMTEAKQTLKQTVTRNKEGHYIMIKGSIQEEDITIVNVYAPNIGTPQYIRQILTTMKGEIHNNSMVI